MAEERSMWPWKRKNPQHYIRRGDRFFARGAYHSAIAAYSRAIRRAPNDYAWAYANRGRAYLRIGDLDEALRDFNAAIRLDPRYGDFYYRRGNAHWYLGDYVRAQDDYDRALRYDPRHIDAHIARGLVHMQHGSPDEALADFTRAIELDPHRAESYLSRARFHMARGDYDRAWQDVARCEQAGGGPDPEFLRNLRRLSAGED
jgi:tetratricopeptide (TPR) repeat protein